jgi:hypothetical protein
MHFPMLFLLEVHVHDIGVIPSHSAFSSTRLRCCPNNRFISPSFVNWWKEKWRRQIANGIEKVTIGNATVAFVTAKVDG